MTIKVLMACAATATLIGSSAAAEQRQQMTRENSLEQPPALSEGEQSRNGEQERERSLEQPPPLVEDAANDEELEPTVTIKQQADVTVYEYRLNGLLYGIRVVPRNAPAYYLVDADGDGFMDRRRNDLSSPDLNRIPAWVLFRW